MGTSSSAGALYTNAKTLSITGQEDVVTFDSCTATGSGGAVYVDECKQLVMYNTVFSLNHSSENGEESILHVESPFKKNNRE